MVSISNRIFAGVLACCILPFSAVASDSGAGASSNNAAAASANTPAGSASTKGSAPAATAAAPAASPAAASGLGAAADPLLQLLMTKGVLSAGDIQSLAGAPTAEVRERLLLLLKDKGILSASDLNALNVKAPAAPAAGTSPAMAAGSAAVVAPAPTGATAVADASVAAAPAVLDPQHSGPPQAPASVSSGPVSAVVPIRVMQVDPPKREGVIPAIKLGKSINIQPYGFFKTSAVYDSSSPYGNDFLLPGFIGDINGPNTFPEFHLKDRALRLGSNFEWLDSPNVVITAKFEMDFEGNFSVVNNRNLSAIRSNAPQIRLGYGRIDWKKTDKTSLFLLAGQDWTPFASSTLPNLFETTGLGVGFGTLYERDPQLRVGINHKLGGSRGLEIAPEFALVLPAYGNVGGTATAVTLQNQLGEGERQGVDSARPEFQTRLVTQFQLDNAPNVPPAQIIVSGVQSKRSAVVNDVGVPAAFKAAFPDGARVSSSRYGYTGEIQLPTRWATLIAKYYNGEDLRYFFGGQILSEFNDTTGLTGVATATSIDGSSTVAFGLRGGLPVVAAQRPPRSEGGFLNLGLPFSRWFNADPEGRNAGWVMYLHYGYDQVLARDVRRLGGGREKGEVFAPQLQYKLNKWATFVVEESLYETKALPNAAGALPLFDGKPTRVWRDFRSEIGPIFTF